MSDTKFHTHLALLAILYLSILLHLQLLKNLKIKIYETNFANINILIITYYIYINSHMQQLI
jgi:hypothetical protein